MRCASSGSSMSSGHASDSDIGNGNENDNVNEAGSDELEGESKGTCTLNSKGEQGFGKSCGQMLCFDGAKRLIRVGEEEERDTGADRCEIKGTRTFHFQGGQVPRKSCGQMLCFDGTKGLIKVGEEEERNPGAGADADASAHKNESKGTYTHFSQGGQGSGKSRGEKLCFDRAEGLIRVREEEREECRRSSHSRLQTETETDVFSIKMKNNCEAFGDHINTFDFDHPLDAGNVGLAHEGSSMMQLGHSVSLQMGDDHQRKRSFKEMEMVKRDGLNIGGLRSGPNSERKEIDLELAPNIADGNCSGAAKEMGSQELTLSYMCDEPKPSFKSDSQIALGGSFIAPHELGEKGKDKGKQLALSLLNGTEPADYCGKWLEWDFLHSKTSWEDQSACKIEKGASSRHLSTEEEEDEKEENHQMELCGGKQTQKKPKTECIQLSLGFPDVSLTLASPNLNMPLAPSTQTRSIQSLGHTNHTRTSSLRHTNQTRTSSFGHTNHTRTTSDGFTTSLEYSQSHSFFHNPSCSLTQNSLENNEFSVGSQPVSQGNDQVSYGNWQAPNANEQVSYENNGSMIMPQERLKPGRDISLYQSVLQNGNMQGHHSSQGFLGGNNRNRNSGGNERDGGNSLFQGSHRMQLEQQARNLNGSQAKSDGNETQFSFPRELPERSRRHAWSSPSRSVSSQETRSIQHRRIDKGMSKPEADRDILFQMDKQARDEEQSMLRDRITADRILHEIVLEPINIMAQKLQELPDNILDNVREYLQDLIGGNEKREHFAKFQKILQRRNDLTAEMLIKSHRSQLEILVTIKTGMKTFLGCNHIPISELVDIFLDLRCRNLDCKSQLPVDDCECKVCSYRSGFCSMCMCLICSKFDCASNTCSWVGCDICLHWCHTDCGIGNSYIKPSPSIKGASGTTEMQFYCIACDHSSEMFGFVKEVFKTFSKEWGAETLVKELDFVRRIFQGSEDTRGKQLRNKAEDMLAKLGSKICSPSDVCNSILSFFTECDSKFFGMRNLTSKEPVVPNDREDEHDQFVTAVRESIYKINPSSSEKVASKVLKVCESSDQDHAGKKIETGDLHYDKARHKAEIDELDSIVRIKHAEAQMFQSRADDARREAEGLQRIALAKNNKIEEEYTSKLAKLCLTETEERRRLKLEELHSLETAHHHYYNMKIRMETDIKELLIKMETTRQQLL
ncbi:hypothetical protein KI387_023066 [Taxus chinensis]|uniref:OBERON-like protein n=1 Tax=Taxus chinensis TaxID=29808 RepID=A0AA38G1F7_TAXCH|nr:hypothetical protein KI387_023066 [Taxus chinensis]